MTDAEIIDEIIAAQRRYIADYNTTLTGSRDVARESRRILMLLAELSPALRAACDPTGEIAGGYRLALDNVEAGSLP